MDDELVEQVARAADEYLGVQCGMKLRKHALDGLAKAAIVALQPHIEAQREDAARRALEAAAQDCEENASNAMENGYSEAAESMDAAADFIRAIDPAQFRRPADG